MVDSFCLVWFFFMWPFLGNLYDRRCSSSRQSFGYHPYCPIHLLHSLLRSSLWPWDFVCFVLLFLFGFSQQQPGRIINCGHEVAVRGRAGLCLPPPPHPNIRQPGEPRSKSLFASEFTSGFPHREIHILLVDHCLWIFLSSYTRYYFLSNVYSWMQSFGADSAQNQFELKSQIP